MDVAVWIIPMKKGSIQNSSFLRSLWREVVQSGLGRGFPSSLEITKDPLALQECMAKNRRESYVDNYNITKRPCDRMSKPGYVPLQAIFHIEV